MRIYKYLPEPGVLSDMMFALKLKFNGRHAYDFWKEMPEYTEVEPFLQNIIKKLDFVSPKLLPFFYWDNVQETKTALLAYTRKYHDDIFTEDGGMIEKFCESLRDTNRLKKFLYENYFDEPAPDDLNTNTVREKVYAADIPTDVKMYLLDFFLFGSESIEDIIMDLLRVREICEQVHFESRDKIEQFKLRIDEKLFGKLFSMSKIDCGWQEKIEKCFVTYSVVCPYQLYSEIHGSCMLSYIGILSEKMIYEYKNEIKIDLCELGKIFSDEKRLKIIEKLKKKGMYCAEIAKELGLKNNTVLYHLNMMQEEGIIFARPTWKKIYYYINDDYLDALKKEIDTLYFEK